MKIKNRYIKHIINYIIKSMDIENAEIIDLYNSTYKGYVFSDFKFYTKYANKETNYFFIEKTAGKYIFILLKYGNEIQRKEFIKKLKQKIPHIQDNILINFVVKFNNTYYKFKI